jgi:SAM-dependent methyltransferase
MQPLVSHQVRASGAPCTGLVVRRAAASGPGPEVDDWYRNNALRPVRLFLPTSTRRPGWREQIAVRRAKNRKDTVTVDEKRLREVTAYITKWGHHLNTQFAAKVSPQGKRILVIGSGHGGEVLWLLRKGAAHVSGIDPRDTDRSFIEHALSEEGLSDLAPRFTLHEGTTTTVGDIGTFDAVISNNTFEHVTSLSANLEAIRRFLPDQGSRIHIFTDPLYFSSMGHHLPIGPWEHLTDSQESVQQRVNPRQWGEYREGLNGMTITVFLEAIREAGLIVLDLNVRQDSNIEKFLDVCDYLPPGLKPMDLCISGIGCTLAFPHNL